MGGVYLREEDQTIQSIGKRCTVTVLLTLPLSRLYSISKYVGMTKKNNTKTHAMVVTSTHVDNNSVSLSVT